jgi:hypothetical protein
MIEQSVKSTCERRWKEEITAKFEESSQNLLGETENLQKFQNTPSSDRNLNPGPPEYESGELYCVKNAFISTLRRSCSSDDCE